MKNIKYIIYLTVFVMSMAGCKKFLTVQPATQLTEEEAFASEVGFRQALNGVYAQAANRDLYGDNLTMGFVSALEQDYLLTAAGATHRDAKLFNYTAATVMTTLNTIWTSGYNLIAGANKIISFTESKRSVLSDAGYATCRGEALGMRALMHFDLLRLFGPEYTAGENKKAIPYVTRVTPLPVPASTTQAVADSILTDLKAAAALLITADPILTNSRSRRSMMNYYAVKALEARVRLYIGDKPGARMAALEVTTSTRFPFVTSAAASAAAATRDRLYLPELVLMFRVRDIATWADNGTSTYFRFFTTINDRFTTNQANFNSLYETTSGGATDLRYLYRVELDGGFPFPSKYWQTSSVTAANTLDTNRLNQLVPVLRLSEMHYILAETAGSVSEGISHLNTIRQVRGLPALSTSGTDSYLEAETLKEYRKELYAEGQLFYYYKRKNTMRMQFMTANVPSLAVYTLPIPLTELEYNPTYK